MSESSPDFIPAIRLRRTHKSVAINTSWNRADEAFFAAGASCARCTNLGEHDAHRRRFVRTMHQPW